MITRIRMFKIMVFHPLNALPSLDAEFCIREVAGYETHVFRLCPFSGLEMDLVATIHAKFNIE